MTCDLRATRNPRPYFIALAISGLTTLSSVSALIGPITL
jgi:hypothetical protein